MTSGDQRITDFTVEALGENLLHTIAVQTVVGSLGAKTRAFGMTN
jgi:hypothetical protein